jgi:hypothetical protein
VVHARHEETAAFAAGAEVLLTGKLGGLRRQLWAREPWLWEDRIPAKTGMKHSFLRPGCIIFL